jgi:N-acetylglucosaminyldiphosphoundecaprenol N-acetyl-beta-D-mannosaminyltransferase
MASSPAPDFQRDVICLFGLAFDALDLESAVRRLRDCADRRQRCFVSTPNVNWVAESQHDAALRHSVWSSDLCLVDGQPIVRVARAIGLPLSQRVAGADLFERLRQPRDDGPPLKVYFFGGPEGVAERAAAVLNDEQGGLRCVGAESPGFGSIEQMSEAATIARINDSGADFVVVALGARKGQAWIEHNRSRLDAPLLCHLGAVVNFVAGHVVRAPSIWRRLGLEWLWRIRAEPALWRRYANDGVVFVRLLATQVLPTFWRHTATTGGSPARLEIHASAGRQTLRLHGVWTRAALAPLRAALTQAAAERQVAQLDLSGVEACDAFFVGLVSLASHHQTAAPLVLRQPAVTTTMRRAFRACGADALL